MVLVVLRIWFILKKESPYDASWQYYVTCAIVMYDMEEAAVPILICLTFRRPRCNKFCLCHWAAAAAAKRVSITCREFLNPLLLERYFLEEALMASSALSSVFLTETLDFFSSLAASVFAILFRSTPKIKNIRSQYEKLNVLCCLNCRTGLAF